MPGTEIAPAKSAGFYGKLPARGDFVSRRLDADFIAAWDEWLQRAMAQSREALGAAWLECYLSAPVWRFVAPAGMFAKSGWIGLMLPSVDRVGRYFPLTLAAEVEEPSIDVPATLAKASTWLDSVQAAALAGLEPGLDVDAFDRSLAERPLPDDVTVRLQANDDTVPLGEPPPAFRVWQFGTDAADAVLQQLLAELRVAAALWMTRGGEHFAPCIAACGERIPGAKFSAMLDGRWSEHGWTLAQSASYCDPKTRGVDLVHGQGKEGEQAAPLTASPGSANENQMNTRLEE